MNKELAKTIGTTARDARKVQRLTQDDAAERIGVSSEFYARIERGTSLPSILTFARIVSALGVSADAMLGQHPLSMAAGVMWTPEPPSERPEIRRVLRRLRHATPGALRLVNLILKEFEESEQELASDADAASGPDAASNSNERSSSDAGPGSSVAGDEPANADEGRDHLSASEARSAAHGGDFDGAPARTLRARENEVQTSTDGSTREWGRAS